MNVRRMAMLTLVLVIAAGAWSATACGDDSPSPPGSLDHDRFETTPHGPIVLTTMESPEYGTFLVDENERTLYVYDKDDDGKSNCNQGCAEIRSPYIHGEEVSQLRVGPGINGEVSMITREDGSKQIAYNGRPLYRYGVDKAPGDVTGVAPDNGWTLAVP